MVEEVKNVLEMIRPALQADGGDVELVEVTGDGVVQGEAGRCLWPLPHVHHDTEDGH